MYKTEEILVDVIEEFFVSHILLICSIVMIHFDNIDY